MGTRPKRRRIVATAAGGAAIALVALVAAPQAVTAAPLLGATGLQAAAVGGGLGSASLELDGITTAPASPTDHSQDIPLRSMSWKVSTTALPGGSTGTGAGKAVVDRFTVVKPLDGTTPLLLGAVVTGKRFATAKVFLVRSKPNGTQVEALQYTLKDAIVVDDEESTGGSGTETLQLIARQVEVTYFSGTTAGNTVGIDTVDPVG